MPKIMFQEETFFKGKKISLVCCFLKLTHWSFWIWLNILLFPVLRFPWSVKNYWHQPFKDIIHLFWYPWMQLIWSLGFSWVELSEVSTIFILIQYFPFTEHRCLGDILSKYWDNAFHLYTSAVTKSPTLPSVYLHTTAVLEAILVALVNPNRFPRELQLS